MKNTKLLLILLLMVNSAFSQFDETTNVFPVSPEAGKLGTYGDIPMNLSAGQMNFEVPIWEFDLNGYTWPVKLSYHYTGLILEEDPSICGLGWTLIGGGVVTRQVRGLPDEHPDGYATKTALLNQYFNNNSMAYVHAEKIIKGEIDSEPDKFIVSLPGINFSFKIKKSGTDVYIPEYLSKHNYKVDIFWNKSIITPGEISIRSWDKFVVTDDKGIKYTFQELEFNKDDTRSSSVFTDGFEAYISSWQLSRVDFPNKKYIEFGYSDDLYTKYNFYASGYLNTTQVMCQGQATSFNGYNEGVSETQIHRKLLNSIITTNGILLAPIKEKLYTGISIIDGGGSLRSLNYELKHEHNRNLLTEIKRNGEKYYSFDYHNKSLIPDFIKDKNTKPYAQDEWGYYNGRSSQYAVNVPYSKYSADKNAYFNSVVCGALRKITYPTRGCTKIDYESNQVKTNINNSGNIKYNRFITLKLKTDNHPDSVGEISKSYTYTFEKPTVAEIWHQIIGRDGGSSMHLEMYPINTTDYTIYTNLYDERMGGLNPVPKIKPAVWEDIWGDEYPVPTIIQGDTDGRIIIEPGTYKIRLYSDKNRYDAEGEIKISFYESDYEPSGSGNRNVGGIRIQKIKNHDLKNPKPQIKYFNYNDENGLSRGKLLQPGLFNIQYKINNCCSMLNQFVIKSFERFNYNSRTYNPVNLNNGVPVFYPTVEEYPGMRIEIDTLNKPVDIVGTNPILQPYINWDGTPVYKETIATKKNIYFFGGKKVQKFDYCQMTYKNNNYPFKPQGADKKMGRLIGEEIYKLGSDSTDFKLLKESRNEYLPVLNNTNTGYNSDRELMVQNYMKGLKLGYRIKLEGDATFVPDKTEVNQYFKCEVYREYDNDFFPSHNETISYFDDGTTLKEESYMEYNDNFQLIKNSLIKNPEDTIHTTYTYPNDKFDIISQEMLNRNIVSPVIQSEIKLNDQQIGGNRTNYGFVNPNEIEVKHVGTIADNALIVPSSTEQWQKSKGYTKIGSYDAYGANGNLLQYHKETDINVSIIWDLFNTIPLAKIENAEYTQVKTMLDSYGPVNAASINLLRSEESLKETQITSYTYDLLFNKPITQTDPNGKTTYFNYDNLGRLKRIKDNDTNIVKEYEYNYAKNDVAAFSFHVENNTALFNPKTSDEFKNYHWDFGDGNTSSMSEMPVGGVQNTYNNPGYYNAKLSVTYLDDNQSEVEHTIRILPKPNLSYSSTTSQITLSWDLIPDLTGLKLYKKNGGNSELVKEFTNLSTTSFSISNLAPGLTFTYQFRAIYNTSTSISDNFIAATKLATPVLNYSNIEGNTVELNWNKIDGATSYYIYRSVEGASYSKVGSTLSNEFSFVASCPAKGTEYCFKVEARNSEYTSMSSPLCIITAPEKTIIIHTSSQNNSISFKWDSKKGADRYGIVRSDNSSGPYIFVTGPAPIYTTNYTDNDPDLLPGKKYYYKVAALNDFANTNSDPKGMYTAPSKPSVSYQNVSTNEITLIWNKPSDQKIDNYYIYQYINGSYTKIAETTGTSYTHSSLSPNIYKYIVEARNSWGSTKSDEQTIRILPKPKLSFSSTTSQITLSWDLIPDLTGLRLYKKTGQNYGLVKEFTNLSTTSFTINNLASGTSYTYQLMAICNTSTSVSDDLIAQTRLSKPVVQRDGGTRYTAEFSWEQVTGVFDYAISRSKEGGGFVKINTVHSLETNYVATGLETGTDYCFKVTASNAYDTSEPGVLCLTTTPDGVGSSWTHTQSTFSNISFNWNHSKGQNKYDISRSTSVNGTYKHLATLPGTTTYYTDNSSDLGSGKLYYYKIYAYNDNSGTATKKYMYTAPSKPSVSYQNVSNNAITLIWNKPSDQKIDNYYIYRYINGSYTKIGETTGTSYTHNSLSVNTTYKYKVEARNSWGSTKSNEISVKTAPQPTVVTTGKPTSSSNQISWESRTGAQSYRIYRGNSLIKTVSSSTTSYTDGSLSAQVTYCYKVACVGGFGQSISGAVCETTPAACPSDADICANGPPHPFDLPAFKYPGKVYYDRTDGKYYISGNCSGFYMWFSGKRFSSNMCR